MHDIHSDSGKRTATGIGFFVSAVMLAASGYFNASFGLKLGQTPIDGVVYAIIGVAFEVFLALMPFYFVAALKARTWGSGFFLLVVWLFLIGVSANAAIGHIASSRLSAMSNKMAAATSYQDTRDELKRLKERLGWLPKPADSQDSLRAKIKAQQAQLVWQQTQECANQWNTVTKSFCKAYTDLTSSLTNTIEYDKTVARIEELQKQSAQAANNHVVVIAEGVDAQASLYGKFFKSDAATVSGVISMIFAAAILMIASMGFYISLAPQRAAAQMRKRALDGASAPSGALSRPIEARAIDITPRADARQTLLAPPRTPTDEAQDLLRAIGMPDGPCDKRPKDDRDHVAWRFMAWLAANGYVGDFTASDLDSFYEAFCKADNREPWAERIVKKELQDLRPAMASTSMPRREDGSRATVWTIKPLPLSKLTAILRKKGIASDTPSAPPPTPEQPARSNVFRLFRQAG